MQPLPATVRAAASGRRSLISRQQLLALECSASTINRWLAIGVLERGTRGHYRIGGAALDALEHIATAVARAGESARVYAVWCGGLHGLEGLGLDGEDAIAIPPGRRVRGVDFTVIRTPIPEVDQADVAGFPGVTVARTLIGVAAIRSRRMVRVAFDDARRRDDVRLDELWQRAVELGRVPGAPQMRALLATGQLDMESEGERKLDGIWLPGDPRPQPQVWVTWEGRWYRLDFAYLDGRLDLEYDGRDTHDAERDAERTLALAQLQIQTLRVTRTMLRDRAALRRRILAVRRERVALGLPPIVPMAPPWLADRRSR